MIFIIFFVIAAFNIAVNPYGIFQHTNLQNKKWKPEQVEKTRFAKALAIMWRKPNNIILGSSRTEYGINPDHHLFSSDNTYNAAFSAQSLAESFLFLQHADSINKIHYALITLDFDSFHTSIDNSIDSKIICSDSENCYPYFMLLKTLLSLSHLHSSLKTLKNEELPRFFHLQNGMRDPDHNKFFIAEAGGYNNAFEIFEKHIVKNFSGKEATFSEKSIETFEAILEYLHTNNIDADFFISPTHCRKWELLDFTKKDGYATWELWKRILVKENEEIAAKLKVEPYKIWDFTGYDNTYSCESVPSVIDQNKEMQYHWDTSHYKVSLGNKILDQINSSNIQNYFGKIINSNNIDAHLKHIRKDRLSWQKENLEKMTSIKPVLVNLASTGKKIHIDSSHKKLHHLEKTKNDFLSLNGNSPYIIVSLEKSIDGQEYHYFGMDFTCKSQQATPSLKVYWHDKSNKWFQESHSMTVNSEKNTLVFDMMLAPYWDRSHNIKSFRIDLTNHACSAIKIDNLFIAKEKE